MNFFLSFLFDGFPKSLPPKYQYLFPRISNVLGDFLTRKHSISNWDNRLLGLTEYSIQTILDIGANNGQSTKKLHKLFPKANIYAFEPVDTAFSKLKRFADGCSNVRAYNLAVGDENTTIKFNKHPYFTLSSSVLKTTDSCVESYPILAFQEVLEVSQVTLDYIIPTLNIKEEILIKIDVQGYEYKVLEGAINFLDSVLACIVEVSMMPVYENQASFDMIYRLLVSKGFCFVGMIDQAKMPSGVVEYFDAVFINKNRQSLIASINGGNGDILDNYSENG